MALRLWHSCWTLAFDQLVDFWWVVGVLCGEVVNIFFLGQDRTDWVAMVLVCIWAAYLLFLKCSKGSRGSRIGTNLMLDRDYFLVIKLAQLLLAKVDNLEQQFRRRLRPVFHLLLRWFPRVLNDALDSNGVLALVLDLGQGVSPSTHLRPALLLLVLLLQRALINILTVAIRPLHFGSLINDLDIVLLDVVELLHWLYLHQARRLDRFYFDREQLSGVILDRGAIRNVPVSPEISWLQRLHVHLRRLLSIKLAMHLIVNKLPFIFKFTFVDRKIFFQFQAACSVCLVDQPKTLLVNEFLRPSNSLLLLVTIQGKCGYWCGLSTLIALSVARLPALPCLLILLLLVGWLLILVARPTTDN